MKVGIIGSGEVGQALGRGFATLGHEVKIGTREPAKLDAWRAAAGAKQTVTGILRDFGWPATDIGGIEGARYLEPLAMLWIVVGSRANHWAQAFKLLKK